MGDVTVLIAQAHAGDRSAFDRLYELLYPELRRIAHRRLAPHERNPQLDTTALVHECYLRFAEAERIAPASRAHFLAYAANVMRSVIVDAARQAMAQRHGGDVQHVPLDTDLQNALPDAAVTEILGVHAALQDLARLDPRLAQVVEMRYFAGMTDGEIAEVLGLSLRTVGRDWEKARLLLAQALRG